MLTYVTRQKLDDRETAAVEWAEAQDGFGEFRCRYSPRIGRDPDAAEAPGDPQFYSFEGRTLMAGELMRLYWQRPQPEILDFREVPRMPSWMWIIIGFLGIILLVLLILARI